MRTKILFSLFAIALFNPSFSQKKIDRQYFINLLNAGEYNKVFKEAIQLRKEVYGKNAVVDYFIAKSLCLDGHVEKSVYCFNSIINNYRLSGGRREFIQKEITSCNAPPSESDASAVAADFSYLNNVALPEATVGGKMGRVYDCFSKTQIIDFNQMVSAEELESRLFSISDKTKAMEKVRKLVTNEYVTATGGRYIFVTHKNYPLSNNNVRKVTEGLEKAYNFFVSYFQLRPPDKLLTVYILPDKASLRKTAMLVHGIKLPDANIGYSNLSDLSLLGLGDANNLGTLYHELFHLIIRTDLGDIPPFLDEGLASLYSVSYWENNKLRGHFRPWRLDELKEARNSHDVHLKIPSLEKLINYSWNEFDGNETYNVCAAAVNYALSNFLMIYLQEKNMLQLIVNAYKERPFVDYMSSEKPPSSLAVFEKAVKDSINSFAKDFDLWFTAKYKFDLYQSNTNTSGGVVSSFQLIENSRALLLDVEPKIKSSEFSLLRIELDSMEYEFRKLERTPVLNIPPPNAVQQRLPEDPNAIRKKELEFRLMEFNKKLRKILFDATPKTAN